MSQTPGVSLGEPRLDLRMPHAESSRGIARLVLHFASRESTWWIPDGSRRGGLLSVNRNGRRWRGRLGVRGPLRLLGRPPAFRRRPHLGEHLSVVSLPARQGEHAEPGVPRRAHTRTPNRHRKDAGDTRPAPRSAAPDAGRRRRRRQARRRCRRARSDVGVGSDSAGTMRSQTGRHREGLSMRPWHPHRSLQHRGVRAPRRPCRRSRATARRHARPLPSRPPARTSAPRSLG